jgi:hypothetical protein
MARIFTEEELKKSKVYKDGRRVIPRRKSPQPPEKPPEVKPPKKLEVIPKAPEPKNDKQDAAEIAALEKTAEEAGRLNDIMADVATQIKTAVQSTKEKERIESLDLTVKGWTRNGRIKNVHLKVTYGKTNAGNQ